MYKNLEAELTRNSYTQNDISKLLNISVSTVSDKMNGKREFKLIECKKLSKWLNASIDYLFKEETNNNDVQTSELQ